MEGEMACSLRCQRAQSPLLIRPKMSDLRIVLLGKNASENNKVGNLILDKKVFGKKTPQPDVEEHSERLEERKITVINTINLLKSKFTLKKIAQKVSEFSTPEPDVIILVLQHNDFSERKRDRLPSVLNCFGEQVMKHTMIVTTDDEPHSAKHKPVKENEFIQQISTECGGGRLQLQNTQRSQILQNVDEIINRSKLSNVYKSSENQKLILVLCGCSEELKASMSKLLLGKKMSISAEQELRSVYVMEEEKIHGQPISVVNLPALNRFSEEEVMRQTLRCVSLCDPGVHVFLLIIPDTPLTDEDKAEIKKIQKIFDSREHFIVLFVTTLSVEEHVTDLITSNPESEKLISLFGGKHKVIGLKEHENSRQILELLDYIENMKTEPYSLQTYVKAQENRVRRDAEEKYKEELKKMEKEIDGLKQKIQSEGSDNNADDQECLRIVLIGRTGSGKSSTGNTILGRNEFVSEAKTESVTIVCEKRVGEVDGRSVAVVDTPGLFDTKLTNDKVVEEIVKCVSLSSPGPHVFVIVLGVGRFIQVEADTLDLIKKIFGPKSAQFSIVLFTRGDDLEGKSIEDYVRESNSAELKKLIRDCGKRFLVFNNREKQDKTQVIQLLNMIEELKNTNEGRYFTNSMFEKAEMSIKKRMEEILKEREREIQNQKKELQTKYEREMKIMLKRLEEEKEKADKERMEMENQLREKEENFRKKVEENEKIKQKKREIENQKRSEEEKQRAEYHRKIEEMEKEIENQRLQYEKQQKESEEKNLKRKEKYRKDQEKMKNEQEHMIAELKIKQEEEIKKRELEEKRRHEEEEEERQRWKRKIKEAENDRKETQEEIKRQQREWEDEKKRQMREREEEERRRKDKHEEQLREKQEELEKIRKRFEREKEEERQKIEEERQKQRREKEREYEEKKAEIEKLFKQLEREKKVEWERRKDDDERREEEGKRWKRMIEDLKQARGEIKRTKTEERERKEREEKDRNEMKQTHEEEITVIKKKHEDEARKQAEEFNESTERKLKYVLELTEMIKEYQEEKLKNKPDCVIH